MNQSSPLPEITKYLASIGAKGGKKSKRKLTKKQASQMATKRWQRVKAPCYAIVMQPEKT